MISRTSLAFFRSYVIIAAGILVIALVLDSLLVWMLPADARHAADRYARDVALVELLLLEREGGAAQIAQRFRTLQPQLQAALGFPVGLYELTDLGNQQDFLNELSGGQLTAYRDAQDREMLYRLLPATEQVLAFGPLPQTQPSDNFIENAVIFAYYLLVALFLFLWIRPFYRDLSALRTAAIRFGLDDLDARVQVPEGSSIQPVAQAFNRMAGRIHYLLTAHQDLTNAVAHELRTPLARFKFSLQMLPDIRDEARLADHVDAMKADVLELEALIDEMLTYARLSEDNLQVALDSLPVAPWLERQLLPYAESAVPVRLQLQGDTAFRYARFHPDLMARALHNIVRNCQRYAQTEVNIVFAIEGATAIIRISDDGPGIPPPFHERVFEPFARLDTSRDRQSGGYGLGLAIARRIVQRHGGNIHIDKRHTPGACFVLHWPHQCPVD